MTLHEPPRWKTNNVVSKQVRHKPGCTSTEECYRLGILDLERNFTIRVAKTKPLISFAVTISFTVTAKLICAFVFAKADCWFSHVAAHMIT